MSKPKIVIPSKCVGFEMQRTIYTYTDRDTILYALSLGISRDPLDEDDLAFTYENSQDFMCMPTQAVLIPNFNEIFDSLTKCEGIPEFNPMMLLHGTERIVLHRPLQTHGSIRQRSYIKKS